VLDCLGKSDRALQLLDSAHALLAEVLSHNHPRTLVAARNAQRVRHRAVCLGGGVKEGAAAGGAVRGGGSAVDGDSSDDEKARGLGQGGQAVGGARSRLLAAVGSRLAGAGVGGVGGGGSHSSSKRKGVRQRRRDYTDVEYLGGGMFQVRLENTGCWLVGVWRRGLSWGFGVAGGQAGGWSW